VGKFKAGKECLKVTITYADREPLVYEAKYGELKLFPLEVGQRAKLHLEPARGLDVGSGKGKVHEGTAIGGVVGIIIDTRGRQPFEIPTDPHQRVAKLQEWMKALNAYPEEMYSMK